MKEKKYIYGWTIYIVANDGYKFEHTTLWQPSASIDDVRLELRLLAAKGWRTKVISVRQPNPAAPAI